MSASFIKGSEYMIAKHEGPRVYTVAIYGEAASDEGPRGPRGGELVQVFEKTVRSKAEAIALMKRLFHSLFPRIEVNYLDQEGNDMAPWFNDWEYR